MSTQQIHDKFKVFVGAVQSGGSIDSVASAVDGFVRDARVAPKSIGVEYLEGAKKLVLSLGYRDDESPYEVKLETLSLGKLGSLDAADIGRLESAMTAATAKVASIICHELFVTETGDCRMVVMRRA